MAADPYLRRLQVMNAMRAAQQAEHTRRLHEAQFAAQQEERMRQEAHRQAMEARLRQQGVFQAQLGQQGLDLRREQFQRQWERDKEEMRLKREAEARAAVDRQRGALRPGYRWNAQNPMQQELIPGGPEEQKMKAAHAEDLAKIEAINNATAGIVSRIGSIMRPSAQGAFNSNFGGYNAKLLTQFLPGQTQDVKAEIEQLKAMLKTAGLADIRGRSGQSIGAITEREWPVLAQQIANLDPLMSEPAAREALMSIRRSMLNMRNKDLRQYEGEWSGTPFYQKTPIPMPPIEAEGKRKGMPKTFAHGPEVWDNLTDEEKSLWVPGLK